MGSSHNGQFHEPIKRLIAGQTRHRLILSKGHAKQSRVRSTMRWWTKCVSMVIAKTASRNIAFKAGTMSKAILDAQSSFVTPEATGQEASSDLQSPGDDEVERNADLYILLNHERSH